MGNKNHPFVQPDWTACGCDQTCHCEHVCAETSCAETPACGCDAVYETPAQHHCANNETHVFFEACDGYKEVTVIGTCQESAAPGRVLDVMPTLSNVCPGRRSALGLTLTELDAAGVEHARGFQAITVPAHNGRCNQDMTLETVRFVLPEENCHQQRRHFIVRTQHHYLDAGNLWSNARCPRG